MSGLPVIVKGIESPEDADTAIKAGADAIGCLIMVVVSWIVHQQPLMYCQPLPKS